MSWIDPDSQIGLLGALVGGGFDLGIQLLTNGGRLECVNWNHVAISAGLGMVGAGLGSTLQKSRNIRAAYQKGLNAGKNKGLSPKEAYDLRRNLGAQLKKDTPQPFRSMIYKRNMKKYGDPLGPKFDPLKHTDVNKILTDTNPVVNGILKLPAKGLPSLGAGIGGAVGSGLPLETKCEC